MYVAGPINTQDEARALEQAAYLTDLRTRLTPSQRRRGQMTMPPPRLPNL
jgi:hypothetical protein